jgi:hypothetical protein
LKKTIFTLQYLGVNIVGCEKGLKQNKNWLHKHKKGVEKAETKENRSTLMTFVVLLGGVGKQ